MEKIVKDTLIYLLSKRKKIFELMGTGEKNDMWAGSFSRLNIEIDLLKKLCEKNRRSIGQSNRSTHMTPGDAKSNPHIL
jgi:hypothetical protein